MKLIRKPLVAVGIDPGTTLGYAILDLSGNLLRIGSERGGSLKRLIEESTYYGIPVIAATDKAKCPELVRQFSAKTGARVVAPPSDLLSDEKKALAIGINAGNDHEFDAVSAAMFGLKRFSGMLSKVDASLKGKNDERFSDDVKRLMILRDGLGIGAALKIAEEKEKRRFEAPGKSVEREECMEEFMPSREDYIRLKASLKKLDGEYRELKRNQESLADELERMQDEERDGVQENGNAKSKRGFNRLLKLKTKRIRELEKMLMAEKERNDKLKGLVSNIGPKLLVKRLDNLTYDEFLKKQRELGIHEGDILLVGDMESHSKRTLEALRGRVGVILYRGRLPSDVRNSRDFAFLDASRLKLIEVEDFALAERVEFERLRRDSGAVADMFERYKESRKRGKD